MSIAHPGTSDGQRPATCAPDHADNAQTGDPPPTLLVISPCRDEGAYLRVAIESVLEQSVRPTLWVLVDDGSTDETPAILEEYAARHSFMRVVRRSDRGERSVGPGVVEAFYAGLASVELDQFEFLCKLDLDLRLPPRYFETLMERMRADPRLGTCSGKAYYVEGRTGRVLSEGIGDDVSAGLTKLYRTECFREIGGFVRGVMWDGIDCHRCRMLGWRACSFADPELAFAHLRPMGSSHRGILRGRMRHGEGQHFMGTAWPYMLASAAYRMARWPLVVGGLAMLWGYAWSAIRGRPRYGDTEFRRFLRRYHRCVLMRGKHRAIEAVSVRAERT
jgi:poly-beta-1,6-N-acetyl-D-glucosamine synthase